MPEKWYTIGSFTFPSSWGAILTSFILTFLLLFFVNRKASDWYANSVFYFLLVWKLSVIIVDLQTVIKHPITILYFHGGRVGYWLGLIGAFLYIFFKKVDKRSNQVMAWMSTIVFFEFAFRILENEFLVAFIQFIMNSAILLFVRMKTKEPKGDIWTVQMLIVFTLLQLFTRSFNGGFEFTTVTWTYILVMTYFIFLYVRRKHIE